MIITSPVSVGVIVEGMLTSIQEYQPEDASQMQLKQRFLNLIERQAKPWERQNNCPGHLTASSVVLDGTLQKILLVHHCMLRRWVQPGGHIEPHDGALAQAAVRELAEETGIAADLSQASIFDLDIHQACANTFEPFHLHFDVRFWIVTNENQIRSESPDAEARWWSLSEDQPEADMNRLLRKCRIRRAQLLG